LLNCNRKFDGPNQAVAKAGELLSPAFEAIEKETLADTEIRLMSRRYDSCMKTAGFTVSGSRPAVVGVVMQGTAQRSTVLTGRYGGERNSELGEHGGCNIETQCNALVPMTPITDRPADVEERLTGGHWEGDFIVGKGGGSAIGTIVERKSRFTILVHLNGTRSAETLRDELIKSFEQLPAHLRLSLTWDQGMEMSRHHEISASLWLPVYFCAPHSPWQRGTNENTNGLLREYSRKAPTNRFIQKRT
jgi:hypothetical protein